MKLDLTITVAVLSILLLQGQCNTEEESTIGLPTFLSEPTNITVEEGRTARLDCSVSFLTSNQVVAWMKEDTFQTSGNEVLVSEKQERYSIQKDTFDDHLEFHLEIRNATASDVGAYLCCIVEFGERDLRRWKKSRTATIDVIPRWAQPKLRCFDPPKADADGFVTTETSVAVGCSVRDAEWSRSLELQENGMTVAMDSVSLKNKTAKLRKLRHRIKPNNGEFQEGIYTCSMHYSLRDGTAKTETCTIGSFSVRRPPPPPTTQPPVYISEDENSLWTKDGEDATFYCPPRDSKSIDGRRLAWTIYPPLSQDRYIFKYDGKELRITNVSNSDSGTLVTCVIYSEELGRKDIETTLRVGVQPLFTEQGDDPNARRPPSNMAGGRRGNSEPRLVLPDMTNPDWKTLHAIWNGIRHDTDTGLIHDIDLPVDILESLPTLGQDLGQTTTTISNTPFLHKTHKIRLTTTSQVTTTLPSTTTGFNESIVEGPLLDIRDLLPNEVLHKDESKFGKPSLFTGLILMCSAALILVLFLSLTVGLRCRTKEKKEKPKPEISDPIPLSLPERCMDTTYEEMHANLNKKFPAHSIVAGPSGATMLEPRYHDPSASSCNSELVFGTNQVDFTVEPFYSPQEHVYGGSLQPVNSEHWTLDLDNLPPPGITFHDPALYQPDAIVSSNHGNNPTHPGHAYRPSVCHQNSEELPESRDSDYSRELPLSYCDREYCSEFPQHSSGESSRLETDIDTTPYNSSIGSDPYKFEPIQADRQHHHNHHHHHHHHHRNHPVPLPRLNNQPFNGLSRESSNASSFGNQNKQEDYDPDYLPPRMTSWFNGPTPFQQPSHTPYGLYEVL